MMYFFNHSTWRFPIGAAAWLVIATVMCINFVAAADSVDNEQLRFFESEVRPLLAEKCWGCHNAEKQKGDLRLDSHTAMIAGGESGAAIEPGNPDESLLIQAIRYESLEMPPSGQLDESQIAVLTKWVSLGAPWPQSNLSIAADSHRFSDEDRNWWAFQPVKRPAVPAVRIASWPLNEIDHFILDRMQSERLSPAPQVDAVALVRRLYFDVVGLPPTPAQVADFVDNQSDNAYQELVEQLLDSKGYGERAARQWLDLVRYADSDGYRADGFRDNAWRYRDYVIKSFNDDKPYDRFVEEQIAGDELFPESIEAQVALGYLRHWVYEWNIRDAPGQWRTIMEDVTDTTADVFLGLGLQCAKCHNHKFDPLLQKDYFRLQAYFAPLVPVDVTVATAAEISQYESALQFWDEKSASIRSEIAALEAPYRELLKERAISRFPEDIQVIARKSRGDQAPYEQQIAYLVRRQVDDEYSRIEAEMKSDEKDRLLDLKRQLEAVKDLRPDPLPTAMGVSDIGPIAPPTFIAKRPDELIEPGIPSILDEQPATIQRGPSKSITTGRRASLAKWMTDPTNPLTTRVIVNRIWQSHFGRGLAANASDFGKLGEAPTHPELLDWLTSEFIDNGWSLKSLHRMILNSATYRQASTHPDYEAYHVIDPLNRYYWRSETRRLQAEQIRDAVLAVSGQLEERGGGPSVMADGNARTIYTRVLRNSPDELLDSFDLPLFFSSSASRNTTTTPVQSLLLINSELMLGHARKLASSIRSESGDVSAQVTRVWNWVYGRQPTDFELEQSIHFFRAQTARINRLQAGDGSRLIETAKMPYRDGQSVRFGLENQELRLAVEDDGVMNVDDFTIETFFELRSVDQGSAVRTLVAKWNGQTTNAGWRFGVTGRGSRRKPQTLVLQMIGQQAAGELSEAALFSDQHVEIDTPYYAAACVTLAKDGQPGTVKFYLKNLSNDDEPLLVAEIEHQVTGGFANGLPLTFGRVDGDKPAVFDGLIDDVRLVMRSLPVDQLLYSAEKVVADTIGYWQFESNPGVMSNSANDTLEIKANGKSIIQLSADETAFVDFCHSLLNSNEFLYVR